jgi:malic enzyme
LRKELKCLKQAFDEFNATDERLEDAHEKLSKAHSKLEKAHSSLVEQHEKVIITCDVGLTCDIIDESFYKPIIVALANPSYSSSSTTTTTSPMSDGFTCNASLMVENKTLKKEVNELTLALGKAYGGED